MSTIDDVSELGEKVDSAKDDALDLLGKCRGTSIEEGLTIILYGLAMVSRKISDAIEEVDG